MPGWDEFLARIEPEPHFVAPRFRVAVAGRGEDLQLSFDRLLERIAGGGERTTWVQGPGGCGKTTFVRHALRSWLLRKDRQGRSDVVAPVIVELASLRKLRSTSLAPLDLAKQLRPGGVDEPLWKARVERRRAVIVIDALNEIQRRLRLESDPRGLRHVLDELVYSPSELPVLVTSRLEPDPDFAPRYFHRTEHVELAPFNLEETREYIAGRGLDPNRTTDEIVGLGMSGSANNPYLLRLLCDYVQQKGHHPETQPPRCRIELLRIPASEALAEHRLAARERGLASSGLNHDAVLCAASLVTLADAQPRVAQVEDLLGQVWDSPDVASMVDAFFDTHLTVRHPDGGFTLQHDSLIDGGLAIPFRARELPPFAAALGVAEQLAGDWVGLQPDPDSAALHASEWLQSRSRHDLLVDMAVANQGVLCEHTRRALWRGAGRGLIMRREVRDRTATALSRLGRDASVDASRYGVLDDISGGDRDLLMKYMRLLRTGRLNARSHQTLHRAKNFGQPSARDSGGPASGRPLRADRTRIGLYITECASGDASVRRTAVRQLAIPGLARAIPALVQRLQSDADHIIRISAAHSLGLVGIDDVEAVEALRNSLKYDPRAGVRESAARALGLIGAGDEDVLKDLTAALRFDAVSIVRVAAGSALGSAGRGDADTVAALSSSLKGDPAANVRGSAATALGLVGGGDGGAAELLIYTLANDAAPEVRGSAARALGLIGAGDKGVAALATALRSDETPDARFSAAYALGLLGVSKPEAIQALVARLGSDPSAAVRGTAGHALGLVGVRDPEAVQALVAALRSDEASDVRGSAANALGLIGVGDKDAIDALIVAVREDSDRGCRGSAADALGLIGVGHRDAIQTLIQALGEDADSKCRGSAAHALALIGVGDQDAIRALIRSLQTDEQPHVRGSSANALGIIGIGATDVVQALVDCANDDAAPVEARNSAVDALSRLNADPHPWAAALYERLGSTHGIPFERRGAFRWFRGKVVDFFAGAAPRDENVRFLDRVARHDTDQKSRTRAIQGLARWDRFSHDLIAFLIDPLYSRADGRRRDTDAGVRGEVGRAILRGFHGGATPHDEDLDLTLRMLADPDIYPSTITSACTALYELAPTDRGRALRAIRAHARLRGEVHPFLPVVLGRVEQQTMQDSAAIDEFRRLVADPVGALRLLQTQAPRQRPRGAASPASVPNYVFRPQGGQFEVRFGDEMGFLPNHAGIQYIHQLLRHPDRPHTPLELDGGGTELRGTMNPSRQLVADRGVDYQQVQDTLRAQIESARAADDAERALELQEDLDLIDEQSALARHGAAFPGDYQRAVHRIRTSILRALKMIQGDSGLPRLAHHLQTSIVTDGFRYAPGPDVIHWELD